MKIGDIVTFHDSPYWVKKPEFKIVNIENDEYPRIFIQCIKNGWRSFFGTRKEFFNIGDAAFPVWEESLEIVIEN